MHPTRVSAPDLKAITVLLASTATPERGGLTYFEAVLPAEDRLAATRVVRDLGALPPGLESVGNDGSGSEYPANLKAPFPGRRRSLQNVRTRTFEEPDVRRSSVGDPYVRRGAQRQSNHRQLDRILDRLPRGSTPW